MLGTTAVAHGPCGLAALTSLIFASAFLFSHPASGPLYCCFHLLEGMLFSQRPGLPSYLLHGEA